MLNILKIFCVLFLVGRINLSAAGEKSFQPSKKCMHKYGAKSSPSNSVQQIKAACAKFCTSPSQMTDYEFSGLSPSKFATLCSAFEDTPENNERQQMCLRKFNTTLDGPSVDIKLWELQYQCAVSCMVPKVELTPYPGLKNDDYVKMCASIEDTPANNERQHMCLNRYETTLRLPNVYVSVPYMKYLCGMLCIMPTAPMNLERPFILTKHLLAKICPAMENTDVQQMCLNKYNAIWPTSGADDGEMIKYKCAESCFSPDLFKLWLEHVREASFVAQFDYQKVCPSLEYTPEIRERVQMCNNKYNTTTKVKLSEMARLDEVRFLCALACISIDLTKAYVPDDFHVENFQTQIETRCPFIENTPENNSKHRKCFEKYKAPQQLTDHFPRNDLYNRYQCALDCIVRQLNEDGENCSAYEN